MSVFYLMVIIFVLGYLGIVFEHQLRIDKAAFAVLTGAVLWAILAFGGVELLDVGNSSNWNEFKESIGAVDISLENFQDYLVHKQMIHIVSEIAFLIFFLLGALAIVEVIAIYEGLSTVIKYIRGFNSLGLLWSLSFATFFFSAILDNLTTTIVMTVLLTKIIPDWKPKWYFISMIIIAANAGGAWSPIGDITTIMLWAGGYVSAPNIIYAVFVPSIISMIVPLVIISIIISRMDITKTELSDNYALPARERKLVFILGVCALISVPIFKAVTHLPPFMGILLALGVLWTFLDWRVSRKHYLLRKVHSLTSILKTIDLSTLVFFMGILLAVSALGVAGHLEILQKKIDGQSIYLTNILIGVFSAIVDNVPLVAGVISMYPVSDLPAIGEYQQDGMFWNMLTYCAGTGGSVLIIGSAAGVAAMGIENISFTWYLRKISWVALIGFLVGSLYYLF